MRAQPCPPLRAPTTPYSSARAYAGGQRPARAFAVSEEVEAGELVEATQRGRSAGSCGSSRSSTSIGATRWAKGGSSIAFRVAFQSPERTLSRRDAAALRERIVGELGRRFGAQAENRPGGLGGTPARARRRRRPQLGAHRAFVAGVPERLAGLHVGVDVGEPVDREAFAHCAHDGVVPVDREGAAANEPDAAGP